MKEILRLLITAERPTLLLLAHVLAMAPLVMALVAILVLTR